MTNAEKYGHLNMTNDELEARISADLYELAERLQQDSKTVSIGALLYSFMRKIREAYRTAALVLGNV